MKALIKKVMGIGVFASAKNVMGRKSSGREDYAGYKNWRATTDKDSVN